MHLSQEKINDTTIKLSFKASQSNLDKAKTKVISRLKKNVTVPGFRAGKAPDHLIEKNIESTVIQSEVIDEIINQLYPEAVQEKKLRIVSQPKIEVTKFVPFTVLEFSAEVEIIDDIKLPDYKKVKIAAKPVSVTAKDVTEVLNNLASRGATKESVTTAAKKDDEVNIDFAGYDIKTKKLIEGTDGKAYPLVIGSKSFIPGFEEEMIGLKANESKEFNIKFPDDYGAKHLQSKTILFKVSVNDVLAVKPAKIDDKFATTIGPFKSLAELKSDIKKQLTAERNGESQRAQENEILQAIAKKSTIAVPKSLISEEVDRMEAEEKRNIVYRGQTWQEHLKEEGLSDEEHRDKQRPGAELRVKTGIILGEIAEAEGIKVTEDEFQTRMQLLRGQYSDSAMQAELDKPENQRDIMSRMLTEKTLDLLRSYSK